jgi:outer membrane protein TolC
MRSKSIALLALGLSLPALAQTLSLSEAIQSALAQNPRLQAAQAGTDAASAQASQARWERIGRLELGALWAPEVKNSQVSFPGAPPAIPPFRFDLALQRRNNLELSYVQPLWTWGALAGRVKAASQQTEASADLTAREKEQIRFEATQRFLQAQQSAEAVKVAEQALAQQLAFLATARARVAEGVAPRLDVLKAELAVSQAESDLINQRNHARTSREELIAVTRDLRFRQQPLAPVEAPSGDLPPEADCLQWARDRRLDLRSLTRQVRALRMSAQAERASGLPALNLQASWSQRSDQLGNLGETLNRTTLVGLAVRWEGLGPQRARARSADFEARARQREAQAASLEDQLAVEVRTARWKVEDARAQITVASRALAQAEERARVSRVAYRAGTTTAVEAEDAELALSQARYQVLTTRLEAGIAWAALELSIGQ